MKNKIIKTLLIILLMFLAVFVVKITLWGISSLVVLIFNNQLVGDLVAAMVELIIVVVVVYFTIVKED